MRTALLAALVGSTALSLSAVAQTQSQLPQSTMAQGEAQAKAASVECDRLLAFLDESRPIAGVTMQQARRWKESSEVEECRRALERVTQASKPADESQRSASAQQEPAARAEAAPASQQAAPASSAAPRVVVQQAQPSVTVRQGQPEIIVRIPPPVITVQQAQPEIIVRMPEPDVNVAVARPEVQVTIPQPQVQVQAPQQDAKADVQIERQQPNVRVERTGEPQIDYQPAEGQPQIRFEPMGAQASAGASSTGAPAPAGTTASVSQQTAQAQLNASSSGYGTTPGLAGAPGDTTKPADQRGTLPAASAEPKATGALPSPGQQLEVSKLADMAVYTARDKKLGEIDRVVSGPDGKAQVVMTHGGFLGLGERKVLIPLEQLALRDNRLVADRLSDDQIKALPDYEKGERFRELEGRQTAPIRVAR